MVRLRDIAEQVQELLEGATTEFLAADTEHPYVRDIRDVQSVYRRLDSPVHRGQVLPWMMCSFEPDVSLLEPFNIYPARYWAFMRIHRQTSGLPELVTHIAPEQPSAEVLLTPHFHASFSQSKSVETSIVLKQEDGEIDLRFYHTGNLLNPDRTTLSSEFCMPGIAEALAHGCEEEQRSGPVEHDGAPLYVGDLVFYNGGRTPDRKKMRRFILNNISTALVARFVRDIVRKASQAQSA